MSIARKVDGLSAFTAADLKFVFSMEGVNMTGKTGSFRISTAPQAAPIITAAVTILDVFEDDDDVTWSVLQAYAAKTSVAAAKAGLSPSDVGADVTLYYEFRVSAIGGEVGTDAETTLMFGSFIIKGSI